MRPVAILRFSKTEGPGFFAEWLDARGIDHRLVALDQGEPAPTDASAYAGIAMMGGPMSVNDDLPWIAPVEALLRDAVRAEVPVIGHCLGGQLFAKALGAKVSRTPRPEIGWITVDADPAATAQAREWFGGREHFRVFQWHYDAFALPTGATRLLTNGFNPNQAYLVDNRHIGLQCHIEMTTDLVDAWCRAANDELPAQSSAAMHSEQSIRAQLGERIDALHAVAGAVYTRWSQGLRR